MSHRISHVFRFVPILACLISAHTACKEALSPEQTPQRVVIHFLKEAGRGDLDGAAEYVAPESAGDVASWARLLIFPTISSPPTPEDGEKIDKFIGRFYRITEMETTETEATVHVVFVATDMIVEYPSVAENPLVPNSAAFTLKLVRPASGEGSPPGDWKISTLEPITEAR
jgi:hypothetical protein